jgi:hypothetical protein
MIRRLAIAGQSLAAGNIRHYLWFLTAITPLRKLLRTDALDHRRHVRPCLQPVQT